MNKLSPEIISIIVDELGLLHADLRFPYWTGLAPYATISRAWQYAVEAHTFRTVSVKSTDMSMFLDTYCVSNANKAHRQAATRFLEFRACVPTRGHSLADGTSNTDVFRSAVKSLLDELQQWQVGMDLELTFSCQHDVDSIAGDPVQLCADVPDAPDCLMLDESHLEGVIVGRVTSFRVKQNLPNHCELHPTAMCQLAAAFPRLQTLDLAFYDHNTQPQALRVEKRSAFVKGLKHLRVSLRRLQTLRIMYGSGSTDNESLEYHDLEDERGVDQVCEAVRLLAQDTGVRNLELSGILLSPNLFRGHKSWPLLRRFVIEAPIVAPSGKSYFTGDPTLTSPPRLNVESVESDGSSGNGSVEPHDAPEDGKHDATVGADQRPRQSWRSRPDPDTLHPLIQDMTTAVREHMPKLEFGYLKMYSSEDVALFIQCAVAGQPLLHDYPEWDTDGKMNESIPRWKVWMGYGTEWEVPDSVISHWEQWVGENGDVRVRTMGLK